MDRDENIVDSVSHGLNIDVYRHSMRFQGDIFGSLLRSKPERCCEYPGMESGESTDYTFSMKTMAASGGAGDDEGAELLFHFPNAFDRFDDDNMPTLESEWSGQGGKSLAILSRVQGTGNERTLRVSIPEKIESEKNLRAPQVARVAKPEICRGPFASAVNQFSVLVSAENDPIVCRRPASPRPGSMRSSLLGATKYNKVSVLCLLPG